MTLSLDYTEFEWHELCCASTLIHNFDHSFLVAVIAFSINFYFSLARDLWNLVEMGTAKT